MKGRDDDAMRSLSRIMSAPEDSPEVNAEFAEIAANLHHEVKPLLSTVSLPADSLCFNTARHRCHQLPGLLQERPRPQRTSHVDRHWHPGASAAHG